MRTLMALNIFLLVSCTGKQQDTAHMEKPLAAMYIEKMDDQLLTIISDSAQIEIIATGHDWTEGPVFVVSEQMLLYSDIPKNAIYSWKKGEEASVYLQGSGFSGENFTGSEPGSNGLLIDSSGQLILCQHGDRRIARMDAPLSQPEAKFETIVAAYDGKRLNSPNDAVFNRQEDLYFTDPPYGLPARMDDPEKELEYQGVFLLKNSGELLLLTDKLTRPNGIALSPDEKTLYVANSDPDLARWYAYDVNEEGGISNERVFFDATNLVGKEPGLPDGMKVDSAGILYATGPGGVFVFHPEGTLLGIIHTGEATSNCSFNEDETILFITADMNVLKVDLM